MGTKSQNITSLIFITVFNIYAIGAGLSTTYFIYEDITKHDSFFRYTFVSPVVGTLKGAAWPYFIYDKYASKPPAENSKEKLATLMSDAHYTSCRTKIKQFGAPDSFSMSYCSCVTNLLENSGIIDNLLKNNETNIKKLSSRLVVEIELYSDTATAKTEIENCKNAALLEVEKSKTGSNQNKNDRLDEL